MASPWKDKAQEDSSEDLNPVITYRHLLSSGLGVRNPLRVCGLTDMDAFYAACEQNRLKLDPEIPLVVRQWDALIAVNYPARKFGITRMESIGSALEKCPHLRVVHVATFDPSQPDAKPTYTDHPDSETHKVSLDYYRKESKKIMQIFKEMLPDAEVERASIDEAFIDFTEPVRKHILSIMPHLAITPSTGLDTPLPSPPPQGLSLPYPPSRMDPNNGSGLWEDLGILIPLSGNPPESSQPKGTITESKNLPPQAPQKQTSFLNDRQFPDGTRQTAPSAYSWDANYESAFMTGAGEIPPPPDVEEYLDDDNHAQHFSEPEEPFFNWHDIALSIAASLLLRMRDEIKSRLGYTTSAGLARNKFLAKLVASYKKRDNQSILRNLAIPNYLRPVPFQKIRFLGGKLGKTIAEIYEAQTVGDLLGISIGELKSNLGENSIWVWETLRGIDRSEIREKPLVPKTMAASKNLPHPIVHPSEGRHWLRILSGELAFRLQEGRQENPGMWPKTMVLHVRHSYTTQRSKQAPFPFTSEFGMEYICKAAEKLWTDVVGTVAEYDTARAKGKASAMRITNIALSFSNVEVISPGQRSIEGFFNKRKISDSTSDDQQKILPVKQIKSEEGDDNAHSITQASSVTSRLGFHCKRCNKRIQRHIELHIDQEVGLISLRQEHDDFHFAQDLARGDNGLLLLPGRQTETGAQTAGSARQRKRKSQGIERYFQAKE